jgi:diphthine-ammonia ligase
MRVAVLVSGGKDSALALHRVLQESAEAKYLVTMTPLREDSWMFHYPNIHLTALFAEAVGIPLKQERTAGVKEEEVEDLKRVLAGLTIEGVVSGAVTSEYQKQRIEKICTELGFRLITPLWRADPLRLLRELVDSGFKAVITGVYAHGFDSTWLGRKIDNEAIDALLKLHRMHGISLIGEGGEYESLVLDAPYFKKRIELLETETEWKHQRGTLWVKKARLCDKHPAHPTADNS